MANIETAREHDRPSATPESTNLRKRITAPSTRVRLLGWYMALLALALVVGLLLQRSILLSQMNDEVNTLLRQEVEELEQLSTGNDPDTGEPFGNDTEAIFDTFLRRNIPVEGEALFTILDGEPHSSTVTPVQLLDDPEIVETWASITEPTQDELETSAGTVRYLAVPVIADEGPSGVLIATIFLQGPRDEINEVIRTGGIVLGSMFVVASIVAWFVAGQVLRPVRLLTDAARSIQDDNWSQRIPVQGDDEIAQLARTFNDMVDRLEESFVTQRRFIDDASHELRTPITIIRGHLEVMGDDPGEREEVNRLVIDELDRMSRMVEDLLLLARAEHPDFLDLKPIDVADFTAEIAAKASALSAEREWVTVEAADLVLVGDRQRLTQALVNLARNAVEHSAAGSAIKLGSRAEGDDVRFVVADEGEGIPAEEQGRIFERFSRARGTRRSEGAGLGLAIVKTIVDAHGGHVEVSSTPGEGSIFSIVVPTNGPGGNE